MQQAGRAFLIALILGASGSALADEDRAAPTPTQTPSPILYQELVAAAQAGKTDIDYTALRLSYAQTENYDPWGTDTEDLSKQTWDALKSGDCATVIKTSDALLAIDFTPIPVHAMRAQCFDKLGDKDRAGQETAIGRGLVRSLMGSGDGKTAQTAYVVINIKEEYFALSVLGLEIKRQSLAQDNGHSYDILDAVDPKTGDKVSVYFQIDDVTAGEMRMFDKPGKVQTLAPR